jgi:1-deoxy-D-xylulose-5-phosphate synthase
VFLHTVTEKGKGYPFAPESKTRAHGVAPPKEPGTGPQAPAYTKVFGDTLVALGERDPKVVAITAAMPDGTGTTEFGERFPDRFFDVGIAEQHAVTFAAGLACEGLKPVCAIYSTFLQRAYDQVVHDVALQSLPVRFVMDRAGLVGDDGPTHHGVFDVGYLRLLPNMVVMAPKDENELRHMLYTQLQYGNGPTAMRYPRGSGLGVPMDPELREIPIGQAEPLREGDDVLLCALGSMVQPSLLAADLLAQRGVSAAVVNARFVKPLDEELLVEYAARTGNVVTVEESQRTGGFGSAVAELLQDRGLHGIRMAAVALPDAFIEHGSPGILLNQVELTPEAIARRTLALLAVPAAVRETSRRPA